MSTSILDTAVIGAGAAGLIVGKRLSDLGRSFEIFEEHAHIGDSWRERYRSLRLFSPRRYASLPGLRIDVGIFDYPTGAQLGDYLERYVSHFRLPVRTSARVTRLSRRPDGLFRLQLDGAADVLAERVIVTTGAHRVPERPAFAAEIDPAIRQLHSMEYRGPEQLADGPVLVVGAGNSGTDVALEAARTGHAVTIAGRHPGQVPPDIDTPIGNLLSGIFISRLRRLTIDTEKGRAAKAATLGHGIMLVRNKLADLDRAGVVRIPRVESVVDGRPVRVDGAIIEASTIVWCTGSHPDLRFIDVPGVLDADGRPVEHRGLAAGCAGLGFVGLPFQYSVASSTLMGMDQDAQYVMHALAEAETTATSSVRQQGMRA